MCDRGAQDDQGQTRLLKSMRRHDSATKKEPLELGGWMGGVHKSGGRADAAGGLAERLAGWGWLGESGQGLTQTAHSASAGVRNHARLCGDWPAKRPCAVCFETISGQHKLHDKSHAVANGGALPFGNYALGAARKLR